jgi:hypothetical protein
VRYAKHPLAGFWKAARSSPWRRIEFLDFMIKVADQPDREIPAALDNLSTHKPTRDLWLKRHKGPTPDARALAQSSRNMVPDPRGSIAQRRLTPELSKTHQSPSHFSAVQI